MGRIKLPKVPTHRPLYAKKVGIPTFDTIDEICEALDAPKWSVIDYILSTALGKKPTQNLDLKKWLRVK